VWNYRKTVWEGVEGVKEEIGKMDLFLCVENYVDFAILEKVCIFAKYFGCLLFDRLDGSEVN